VPTPLLWYAVAFRDDKQERRPAAMRSLRRRKKGTRRTFLRRALAGGATLATGAAWRFPAVLAEVGPPKIARVQVQTARGRRRTPVAPNWEFSETDDSEFPAIDVRGITVRDGKASLEGLPGLGVVLHEEKLEAPRFEWRL
jgi:hypothetical protein